ncbi:uncharacterized protein LOC131901079 isoform X2 [Peromyscus eremicus]|uniref:uncharacterized protein LOC131901079 isoform X2 n=1 Tax=Peromyscus eremicus TaxID=42410 RepID=UPI0027DBF775|nr:uncharacterized protein LOC131901079 isoform X2 [Peromyscus eremicus]
MGSSLLWCHNFPCALGSGTPPTHCSSRSRVSLAGPFFASRLDLEAWVSRPKAILAAVLLTLKIFIQRSRSLSIKSSHFKYSASRFLSSNSCLDFLPQWTVTCKPNKPFPRIVLVCALSQQ